MIGAMTDLCREMPRSQRKVKLEFGKARHWRVACMDEERKISFPCTQLDCILMPLSVSRLEIRLLRISDYARPRRPSMTRARPEKAVSLPGEASYSLVRSWGLRGDAMCSAGRAEIGGIYMTLPAVGTGSLRRSSSQ